MGCDIHLYVEAKEKGKWISKDQWRVDPYWDAKEDPEEHKMERIAAFYDGRNYDLFAILANVRNGRGFAGVNTGDGFVPIADPKGLPVDVSPEVKQESDKWDCDGHSHSWHTVADLLAYDWTQTTVKRGYVNGPEFFAWSSWQKHRGFGPKSYSGGVWGQNIQHVSVEEMESRIASLTDGLDYHAKAKAIEALQSVYTLVEWDVPYYRAANNFLSETMPRLWRLGDPNDVRIVFWFDN